MNSQFLQNRESHVHLPWWARWRHRLRLLIARRLASLRLHHSCVGLVDGHAVRLKCRTRWSAVLIPPGNAYLRFQGALSTALPRSAWLEWELAVGCALERHVCVLNDQRGLQFDDHPGISLAELLRSGISWQEKRDAIQWAATALRSLHQTRINACGLADWPLSHGDATSRNVIIDHVSRTATWIDFDTRHHPRLAAAIRHADDLRALLWSSLCDLDSNAVADGITATFNGYADATIEGNVKALTMTACPTVFQLAQAQFSWERFAALQRHLRGEESGRY